MKTFCQQLLTLTAGFCLLLSVSVEANEDSQKHYGEKLKGLKTQTINGLLAAPEKHSKANCAVEGVVEKVCEKKGCWLTLRAQDAADAIRMSFKDYGFFVGKDIIGKAVRAEGHVQVTKLTPEQVAHLKSDGADIQSKTDITFVASGLELLANSTPKK